MPRPDCFFSFFCPRTVSRLSLIHPRTVQELLPFLGKIIGLGIIGLSILLLFTPSAVRVIVLLFVLGCASFSHPWVGILFVVGLGLQVSYMLLSKWAARSAEEQALSNAISPLLHPTSGEPIQPTRRKLPTAREIARR